MKKLIAISVVFALLTTAVFAIEISGQVIGAAVVAEGDNIDDSEIYASASMNRIRVQAEGETEDGKFGGWARLDYKGPTASLRDVMMSGVEPALISDILFSGYAWWQPIEQFKLIIGSNGGTCFFEKDGITGWEFHGDAGDTGVGIEEWAYVGSRAWGDTGPFFGGFGENAIMMSIKPMEMLAINLILPFDNPFLRYMDEPGTAGNFYRGTIAQFDFGFDSHNIALTYEGDFYDNTNGRLYLYYGFGQEDGMNIDVGVALELENENNKGLALPPTVGLGFSNAFGDVGLKARLMGVFDSYDVLEDGKEKTYNTTTISLDVLPSFVINNNLTAYIGLGCVVGLDSHKDAELSLDWTFNPYIVVGGSFFAGIQVYSDGTHMDKNNKEQTTIKWAIPIGLNVRF